ncbi:hypothetical protein [Vibrio coralliilyticus]|uniref:hypothetical protein n=1 Tax=Vibrio coralliilyticus TaxID=190893 RepID=UPI001560C2F1|nr:hypothetical protein [Vibrio coralliilyticus]NRF16611.1 hypothetical protein [Vibrio coralliilyticus]
MKFDLNKLQERHLDEVRGFKSRAAYISQLINEDMHKTREAKREAEKNGTIKKS